MNEKSWEGGGLFNRKTLEIKIDEFMLEDTTSSSGLCLVMLDIDHFKKFNDNFGHLVGDEVIRRVANVLKKSVRGSDVAARYGGEEFTVLLPNTPLSGAMVVADTIRSTTEQMRLKRKNSDERLPPVTISSGVSYFRRGESKESLIGRADKALYMSKASGRNRVTGEFQLPVN